MRSRHDEIMSAAQKIVFQRLRQREIKEFSAEHGLHFGIAALHGIADYHDIGIWWNIFGAITFLQCDAFLVQEHRYRRRNIFVRTGDFKAALLQRRRNSAHGRSANPEEMKFLRRFFHADFYAAPMEKETTDSTDRARSKQRFLICAVNPESFRGCITRRHRENLR